jgi:hypothetical protein
MNTEDFKHIRGVKSVKEPTHEQVLLNTLNKEGVIASLEEEPRSVEEGLEKVLKNLDLTLRIEKAELKRRKHKFYICKSIDGGEVWATVALLKMRHQRRVVESTDILIRQVEELLETANDL